MDAAAYDRIYESFNWYHGFFGSAFGCKQWREQGRHYLQALRRFLNRCPLGR